MDVISRLVDMSFFRLQGDEKGIIFRRLRRADRSIEQWGPHHGCAALDEVKGIMCFFDPGQKILPVRGKVHIKLLVEVPADE